MKGSMREMVCGMFETSRLCQLCLLNLQRFMSCMESGEIAKEGGLGFDSTFASFDLELRKE